MTKVLIVQSCFYEKISVMLLEGATRVLKQAQCKYDIVNVPGALEIPTVISIAKDVKGFFSNGSRYDGYIALGCVIRGQTTHYDYVCSESARGLIDLSIREKLAIGNGILTVENEDQALERADMNKKDKGGFAANACLEVIAIKKKFARKN